MKFEEDSLVSKIGVSVIGLLVFLLFGIGAYFAGLRPIADAVRTGWRASSLIEVPAKITDVQMDTTPPNTAIRAHSKPLRRGNTMNGGACVTTVRW